MLERGEDDTPDMGCCLPCPARPSGGAPGPNEGYARNGSAANANARDFPLGPRWWQDSRHERACHLPPALWDAIRFDAAGLVPAIAQQHDTGEVLMLAWMNREAVAETLATGRVCYFSRSRSRLWRKGESSGQTQRLVELRVDCDGDAMLLLVDQDGVACHTGRRKCFFRAVRDGELVEIAAPEMDRRRCTARSPDG